MAEAINRGYYAFSPVNTVFVRTMYKKGTGNDKQRKDAGNQMICPYRNFSQAIKVRYQKLVSSYGRP